MTTSQRRTVGAALVAVGAVMLGAALAFGFAALARGATGFCTIPGRLIIEAQDWWEPIPGISPSTQGHIHMRICAPDPKVPLSGVIDVPVEITSHDNLAHLNLLKFQTDDWGQIVHKTNFDLANDQPFAHTFRIDTRLLKDGLRLFRFYAQAQHNNGNLQVARPILVGLVENGKTNSNASGSDKFKPTSWYKVKAPALDWGYAQAGIKSASLPRTPISAPHTFGLAFGLNAKGSGPPLVNCEVRVDPNFHAGIPGRILASGKAVCTQSSIVVNPAGLSSGPHKLVLIATQAKGSEKHSAVGVFEFVVAP